MGRRFALQLDPSNRRRAITFAWISAAPSKMLRMRASQRMRETGLVEDVNLPDKAHPCSGLKQRLLQVIGQDVAPSRRAATYFLWPFLKALTGGFSFGIGYHL